MAASRASCLAAAASPLPLTTTPRNAIVTAATAYTPSPSPSSPSARSLATLSRRTSPPPLPPPPCSASTSPSFKCTLRSFYSAPPPLATINTADHERDNESLRALFDNSSSAQPQSSSSVASTGLFQIPSLTSPHAFISLARQTLARAQLLVDRIARASHPSTPLSELKQVVRNLDRLSDLLCGVIDMAELVRNAHPDPHWADAANAAYEHLCGYMNVLNTHTALYAVLKKLLATPEITADLSQQAIAVATVFLRDFEKSGIHLPPAHRQRFVELSDEILVLGRAFLQHTAGNGSGGGGGMSDEGDEGGSSPFASPSSSSSSSGEAHHQPIEIPLSWLKDMNPTLLSALKQSCPSATSTTLSFIPSQHPWAFQTILKHAPSERARKIAFGAVNSASTAQVERLERLLKARAELAALTGASSYAEMSLGDKMAKTPDNVDQFLRALTNHHRPRAARDLDKLRRLKLRDQLARRNGDARKLAAKHTSLPAFNAWDRDLYTDAHFRSPALRSLQPLSPYFSLGSAFAGLSRLFSALYGIRFRAAPVASGEVWSEGSGDVMKVEVLDEREGAIGDDSTPVGLIGTIYADLWSREGKPGGAAHYTVRCSRRVDLDDEAGDFTYGRAEDGSRLSPSDLPGSGGGIKNPLSVPTSPQRDRTGHFQHPVVVLMCDFPRPSTSTSLPCLLGWHELETLFHEMGHAIHSMIGRTSYHNVSGTRCATDFVELPSILMEHFVSSPAVMDVVARHYATNAKMPYVHLESHLSAVKSLEGLDTYHQIQLARLDQAYHSKLVVESMRFDSGKVYDSIDTEMLLSPNDQGLATNPTSSISMHPQTKFSHLFGYGSTYYSYLFDRAIASQVFKRLFQRNPLDREAGDKFKNVLRHGGGKDAWSLLGTLLEDGELKQGGREAMKKVGRWGIEDEKETQNSARL